MIINKQADQYIIAHQRGLKAGNKISKTSQSSSRKVDAEKLNRHLTETRELYTKSPFTEVKTKDREVSQENESEKTGSVDEKKYLLEGTKDIYGNLPPPDSGDNTKVYPTLKNKLFPALDAMKETVEQLGSNPSPDEVDRSNVRRLIRAFQPVAEAFEGSYDKKGYKKAMKGIQKLASNFGKFKDVHVVETELAEMYGGADKVPEDMQVKLRASGKEQLKNFSDVYKEFREEGMDKAIKVLKNPEPPKKKKSTKIEKKDTKKLSKNLIALADDLDNKGLIHDDPVEFHEGRKSMRKFLNSMNASQETFGFDKEDVDSMTELVDIYGQAQDKHIACEWLSQNGFKDAEKQMEVRFQEAQKRALDEAGKFLKSGTLERVRGKL